MLAALLAPGPAPAVAAVSDLDIFNFGLRFEYLQATFYTRGRGARHDRSHDGPQAGAGAGAGAHERAHVKIIKSVLGSKRGPQAVLRLPRGHGDRRRLHAHRRGHGGPHRGAARGGTPRIQDRGLTAALFGLLTVEARHAAWARNIVGATPAAAAFDEPRSLAAVDVVVDRTRFVVQRPRTAMRRRAPRMTG